MELGNRNHLSYKSGKLLLDGLLAEGLAEKYGTPLYVYSAKRIRENVQRLRGALRRADKRIDIAYSLKANPNPMLVGEVVESGAFADCASLRELRTAKRAGAKMLLYTGVYASRAEIRAAARIADMISLDDESRLQHVPKTYRGILCFRVNPGSGSGSHPGWVTGGKTKFGIPRRLLGRAYDAALRQGFNRFGLHMMTGSGVLDATEFVERARLALDIAHDIGLPMEVVDIGGGMGIPYGPNQQPLDVGKMAKGIGDVLSKHPLAGQAAAPKRFLLEPGRYLIGDAGVLLSRVTAVKEHPKRYVGIDAGMHTLVRPAMYNAYHEIISVTAAKREVRIAQTLVGPICETSDVIAEDRKLPAFAEGDLVAILDAGAYGAIMASRYGSRGLPREVLVKGRKSKII